MQLEVAGQFQLTSLYDRLWMLLSDLFDAVFEVLEDYR